MKLTRDKIQRMIGSAGYGSSAGGSGGGGGDIIGYATQTWVKSLRWWGATFDPQATDPDNVTGALTGVTDITASGNITAGGNLTVTGNITSSGTITGATLAATTAMTLGGKAVATQEWTGQNYVSIAFFSRLFQAYNGSTAVNPNDLTTTIDNIKAMFGFWTDQYLTALGKNPNVQPSSLYLSQLADVSIPSPTDGQVLTYSAQTAKWIASNASSGTDMATVWANLAASDSSKQIDASHLTTAAATLFTSLVMIGNDLSVTIGGVTKTLTVGYATNSNSAVNANYVWCSSHIGTMWLNINLDYPCFWLTGTDGSIVYPCATAYATDAGTASSATYATSAGDAATLGGTAKSGLFTSLSSTWATNLSATIGGTTLDISSLNANYAGQLRYTQFIWGQSFNGTADVSGDLYLAGSNLRLFDYNNSADCYIVGYRTGSSRAIGVAVEGSSLFEFNDEEFYSAVGIYAASYVTALSDIRYKNVIRHFALNVQTIANASLIQFKWIDGRDQATHVGGIAQEWQAFLPEAVHETKDGKLSMDYGVIAYTAAVSLAKKVVAQQQEIDDLKERLERLEMMFLERKIKRT